MIVQCPECSSQYRVKDDKVPDSGGKITCPKCSNAFVVYPGDDGDASTRGSSSSSSAGSASGGNAGDSAGGIPGSRSPGSGGTSGPSTGSSGGSGGASGTGGNKDENLDESAPTDVMSADELPAFAKGGDDEGTPDPFGGGDEGAGGADSSPVSDPFGSAGADSGDSNAAGGSAGGDGPTLESHVGGGGADASPSSGGTAAGTETETAGGSGASGAAAPGDLSPDYDGPWKVKSNGLTYEFPDTEALNDWRSDRPNSADYEVSADGSNFHPISEFPQLSDQGPGGGPAPSPDQGVHESSPPTGSDVGAPSADESADGDVESPTSPEPASEPEPDGAEATGDRIERDSFELLSEKEKWNNVLYGVLGLLLVIAGGIALQIAGVVEFRRFIPGVAPPGAGQPSAESSGESESPLPETPGSELPLADMSESELANQSIQAAKKAIRNNRFKTAKERLTTAKLYAPKRPEVYELLAKAYDRLGQTEQAKKQRERARTLRMKQKDSTKTGGTEPPPEGQAGSPTGGAKNGAKSGAKGGPEGGGAAAGRAGGSGGRGSGKPQ
ncbi:MAG: zinc-ribbon domain-containing protein [Bradymonadaceae bacterium]